MSLRNTFLNPKKEKEKETVLILKKKKRNTFLNIYLGNWQCLYEFKQFWVCTFDKGGSKI